eukprot:TRINITY_DN29279_c0_g1_i1.p1 TRINITY_DN29279_c0_g1~~TRINITY_DN29279_c0_g1_i1.p1  ORF type:complete len:166 (+),score=42.51 TRINITY_DN29279_c0_g1_i1:82-579(+)
MPLQGVSALLAAGDAAKEARDAVTDELPYWPGAVLTVHVAEKGVQLGSALGLLGAGWGVARGGKFVCSLGKWMPRGQLFGVATSLLLLGSKVPSMDIHGVADRAYRLEHSQSQKHVDLCCRGGLAAGGVLSLAAPGALWRRVLAGSGVGCTAGLLASVATAPSKK